MTFNQQPQFGGVDHRYGEENLKGENIFKINAPSYEAHVVSPDTAPFLKDETKINDALFEALSEAKHGEISGLPPEEEVTRELDDHANVIAIGRRAATLEFTRQIQIEQDAAA